LRCFAGVSIAWVTQSLGCDQGHFGIADYSLMSLAMLGSIAFAQVP
jgi:hypothetical protein